MGFLSNLFKKPQQITKITASTSIERIPHERPPGWKSPKYDPPMKSKQDLKNYPGNVNYQTFKGIATLAKTNKIHNIKPFNTFGKPEALQILVDNGYVPDSIQIERCAPEPPTERQIEAMKKHKDYMPPYMCKDDASALIDRYMTDDPFAGKELLLFTDSLKFQISYYEGYASLCWLLFNRLDVERKIAFFILCVGKFTNGKWNFNKWDKYLNDAKNLMQNQSFMNSLNRFSTHEIYEQQFHPENFTRQTNCYKMASVLI